MSSMVFDPASRPSLPSRVVRPASSFRRNSSAVGVDGRSAMSAGPDGACELVLRPGPALSVVLADPDPATVPRASRLRRPVEDCGVSVSAGAGRPALGARSSTCRRAWSRRTAPSPCPSSRRWPRQRKKWRASRSVGLAPALALDRRWLDRQVRTARAEINGPRHEPHGNRDGLRACPRRAGWATGGTRRPSRARRS